MEQMKNLDQINSIKIAEGTIYEFVASDTEKIRYFFSEGKWWFKKSKNIEEAPKSEVQQKLTNEYLESLRSTK